MAFTVNLWKGKKVTFKKNILPGDDDIFVGASGTRGESFEWQQFPRQKAEQGEVVQFSSSSSKVLASFILIKITIMSIAKKKNNVRKRFASLKF